MFAYSLLAGAVDDAVKHPHALRGFGRAQAGQAWLQPGQLFSFQMSRTEMVNLYRVPQLEIAAQHMAPSLLS